MFAFKTSFESSMVSKSSLDVSLPWTYAESVQHLIVIKLLFLATTLRFIKNNVVKYIYSPQ